MKGTSQKRVADIIKKKKKQVTFFLKLPGQLCLLVLLASRRVHSSYATYFCFAPVNDSIQVSPHDSHCTTNTTRSSNRVTALVLYFPQILESNT